MRIINADALKIKLRNLKTGLAGYGAVFINDVMLQIDDTPTIDTKLEVLSREDFKARMTDIKTISNREDQIMDALYKNGILIDNSLVSEAIAVSIKCLNHAMRLDNTTPIGSEIEYYIYELDWGKKGKDVITWGERKISLTNLDELYDYLLECSSTSL